MSQIKTRDELILLPTYDERLMYSLISQQVGFDTFGVDRVFDQMFLHSAEWKAKRNRIIVRDTIDGYVCDLGVPGIPIAGRVIVHHLNPITIDDIKNSSEKLFADWNLICVSDETHRKIHYAIPEIRKANELTVRYENDTCPWKG